MGRAFLGKSSVLRGIGRVPKIYEPGNVVCSQSAAPGAAARGLFHLQAPFPLEQPFPPLEELREPRGTLGRAAGAVLAAGSCSAPGPAGGSLSFHLVLHFENSVLHSWGEQGQAHGAFPGIGAGTLGVCDSRDMHGTLEPAPELSVRVPCARPCVTLVAPRAELASRGVWDAAQPQPRVSAPRIGVTFRGNSIELCLGITESHGRGGKRPYTHPTTGRDTSPCARVLQAPPAWPWHCQRSHSCSEQSCFKIWPTSGDFKVNKSVA